MATKREIANQVAHRLRAPNDIALIRSIEESVLQAREEVIRQEVTRDRRLPDWTMQTLECLTTEEADLGECDTSFSGIAAMRTVDKVPRPVRTRLPDPYTYVGTPNYTEAFKFIRPEQIIPYRHTRFISGHPRYVVINDYIYTINYYDKLITIRAAFSDPEEASQIDECDPKYEIEGDIITKLKSFLYEEFGGGEAVQRSERQQ